MTTTPGTDGPRAELDARFSSPEAVATPWVETARALTEAELYWLSTVRPDGRPHVTPLLAVWRDETAYVCSGPTEQKVANLATNPRCVLTTGRNLLHGGLDVVVEGGAVRVRDDDRLHALADAWESKYSSEWRFEVRDGVFDGPGGPAHVYAIRPGTVFAFRKGPYSQTRYRLGGG